MSLRTWATSVGIATDIWLSEITGGSPGVTISYRVATACAGGSVAACRICCWLALTVEVDHCSKQLAGEATVPQAALRAGWQIALAFAVVVYGPLLIWSLL